MHRHFYFSPVDVKKPNKSTSRTTARYPIRSGPKQFQAYINGETFVTMDSLCHSQKPHLNVTNVDELCYS